MEVFRENYVLPMTLCGALKDDLDALEAISYRVLPETDLSGRPLLFSVPHTRGGKGLSTQSLVSIVGRRSIDIPVFHFTYLINRFVVAQLRVFWYAVEVISQENTDVSSSYVQVVWNKVRSKKASILNRYGVVYI